MSNTRYGSQRTITIPPVETGRYDAVEQDISSQADLNAIAQAALTRGAEAADKQRIQLWEEPEEEILLLGNMMRDAKLIADELAGLAFLKPENYRTNLRLVRGAAERLKARCTRLIGDAL